MPRVQALGLRALSLGFRVSGLRARNKGLGFRDVYWGPRGKAAQEA